MASPALQARLPILAAIAGFALALGLGVSIGVEPGAYGGGISGGGGGEVLGLAAIVLQRGGIAAIAGLIYALAAVGLGELAAPLVRASTRAAALRFAIGLAILLSLGHILGQLGLLAGRAGPVVAWTPLLLGVGLAAWRGSRMMIQGRRRVASSASPWASLVFTGIGGAVAGLLFLCVAHAPGTLWNSEFGGYDALEYHLQLPQEWLSRGRIEPLTHNVYSFLPGYMESAYYLLAAATGAPTTSAEPHGPIGLLAGDGWRVIACQGLHASLGVAAACLIASLASRLVSTPSCGTPTPGATDSPAELPAEGPDVRGIARLLVLLTPWTIVVATLAYNEMPMLALFAGAMLAACDATLSPARRGTLAGLLVGVACGAKPTALLFCGVPTAILLLGTLPARQWWKAVLPGALAGAIALAPWLIRNWLACGNPAFPFAFTHWLGAAHWDAEQIARFAKEHVTTEPWPTRLRLLFLPDATDPAGPRHRGLMHAQWGVFFPLVLLAGAHALYWWRDQRHRLAFFLWLGLLAQLVLWLATTHIQSRFLLPLVVPGVCLVALGFMSPLGEVKGWAPARLARVGVRVLVSIALLAQAGFLAWVYASQNAGKPSAMLAFAPGDFTSESLRYATDGPQVQRLKELFPQIAVAADVPEGAKVRLLGEAAVFYYPPGCAYNTVWDAWPFKDGEFTDAAAQYVLIDMGSIRRYERSGYLPPSVTPQAIQAWAAAHGTPIRLWPERDMALLRVNR